MPFRFFSSPKFIENLNHLPKEFQDRTKRELEKIKKFPAEHIVKISPFLKGEYAGVNHYKAGRLRVYFRICRVCRQDKHYSIYWECGDCKNISADDVIVLFDVQIRYDDTYDNLEIDKSNIKPF